MGFGRTGAICEKDKIMQILPGSSNDAAAYKRVREVLQSKGLQHPRRPTKPPPGNAGFHPVIAGAAPSPPVIGPVGGRKGRSLSMSEIPGLSCQRSKLTDRPRPDLTNALQTKQPSFDHLVSGDEEALQNCQANHLGAPKMDHQLELGRLSRSLFLLFSDLVPGFDFESRRPDPSRNVAPGGHLKQLTVVACAALGRSGRQLILAFSRSDFGVSAKPRRRAYFDPTGVQLSWKIFFSLYSA
jgi:hypothetical protein